MVTPVAMEDAVPITESDGFTGRNSNRDIRLGMLGPLFVPAASGGGLGNVRPGVLPRTWNGSGFTDLLVTAKETASAQIDIAAGACVIQRTGQGPYIAWTETTKTLTTDAADPTNPRRDIVWARLVDLTIGDVGDHGPVLGITNGAPATSPTDPSIPSGAVPLARLRRDAGVNVVDQDHIDILRGGAGVGQLWTALEGDAIADEGSFPGEMRYRWAQGSLPSIVDVWGTDNEWHGIRDIYLPQPGNSSTTQVDPGATFVVASTVVPDPGWSYRIVCSAAVKYGVSLPDDQQLNPVPMGAMFTLDSTTWASPGSFGYMNLNGISQFKDDQQTLVTGDSLSAILTGSHTLRFLVRNETASRNATVGAGGYKWVIKIVPEPA